MTYSITLQGHVDSPEEEQAQLDKAKEFAGELDGTLNGNFSGAHVGSVNLVENPTASPPPAEGAEAAQAAAAHEAAQAEEPQTEQEGEQ